MNAWHLSLPLAADQKCGWLAGKLEPAVGRVPARFVLLDDVVLTRLSRADLLELDVAVHEIRLDRHVLRIVVRDVNDRILKQIPLRIPFDLDLRENQQTALLVRADTVELTESGPNRRQRRDQTPHTTQSQHSCSSPSGLTQNHVRTPC